MRYKDFEMEFGRRIEEARDEAEVELSILFDSKHSLTLEEQRILRLAQVSPRAAVIESWRLVESAAMQTANRLISGEFNKKTMTFQAIKKLEKDAQIGSSAVSLMRELRSLRNDAAHAPEFALSRAAVIDYAATAGWLISYLENLKAPNKVERSTK
ncbi:MAG: DUF4145 domain-containing protein [Pseudomonadota bacterium]